MRVLDVRNNFSPELASKEAALVLFKSGAVVFPTDTLYGLGVNVFDSEALRRLFLIKKRPASKPVPVMISSIGMAKAVAVIDYKQEGIIKSLWPGPFTFVLRKKSIVPYLVTAGKDSLALRIPNNDFCQRLLADFEGPITCTSANVSGEEPSSDPRAIWGRFELEKHQPDLIVDAGALPTSEPSTIIDLMTPVPKVVRINPASKDQVLKILSAISR
ncbi:MAG: threonylcarbamoyl-AMP synthase [Parcubacteria group bacterium]|nr:threonylcarbamoyl-AMP synthase [Parcubacteria group bacterium]